MNYIEEAEPISNNYKYYNNFAIIGHFISAISMIFLIRNKDPVIIPYTESYSEWTNVNNGTCPLGSRSFETSNGNFCIGTVTKPVSKSFKTSNKTSRNDLINFLIHENKINKTAKTKATTYV